MGDKIGNLDNIGKEVDDINSPSDNSKEPNSNTKNTNPELDEEITEKLEKSKQRELNFVQPDKSSRKTDKEIGLKFLELCEKYNKNFGDDVVFHLTDEKLLRIVNMIKPYHFELNVKILNMFDCVWEEIGIEEEDLYRISIRDPEIKDKVFEMIKNDWGCQINKELIIGVKD